MRIRQAPADRVDLDGLTIAGDPRLHGDYLRGLASGRDDGLLADLFRNSIPRGGAVVDAGAFLGHHTLIAASEVGPGGRVMAFEPNPASYRALRENVRSNGFSARVIALPLGIGAWSGRRSIFDRVAPDRAIDVVKLAAGGGEVEALRGMSRALELSPDVRLFVECDPTALARAGTCVEALLEELSDIGLRARVIEEVRGELVPAGTWLDRVAGNVQLVCAPAASAGRRLARHMLGPRRERAVAIPA